MSELPSSKAELGLQDFAWFCGHYLDIKHYPAQERWADKFQLAVDGDHDGLQLLAPADHGKTSRIVAPAIVWLLARDRNNRICLLSSTDPFAEQISRLAMSHIENRKPIREDFGLQKGDKWAINEWRILRPDLYMKDPSLLAAGVGAEIQGQRFDWIFYDDAVTRKNSRTEAMRGQLKTYIDTDANSRLDHLFGKGKEFFFGHRCEPNDYYSDNDRPRFVYHTDKAILDDTEQKVLCPEKWTYAALAEKRGRDPIGFELLYQQQAAGVGRFVTRISMEKVRVPTLRFLTSMDGANRGQFRMIWLSLDPAFTTTRWSSYVVLTCWGMTHNGQVRLIWGIRDKMTPESMLPLMEMKFRLYMPDHFFIEDNAAQTMLVSHMRKKFPDHSSKFKGVTTVNKDGKLDQEMIQLFEMYNQEKPVIEIPYAGPTEQAFAHAMTEEYVSYPNGKTRDMLMSQYIGFKGIGMLTQEIRKGHVLPNGIMGAVANQARRRFRIFPRGRSFPGGPGM